MSIFLYLNMNFRMIQALSTSTAFLYWVIRFAQNPMHFHTTMLVMAIAIAFVSEFSYRIGKLEEKQKPLKY